MKGKILLLICLILFIVSIAGVSASEDANQTITDDDTLSVSQSDGEILGSADNGTFTDLQKKIDDANESDIINLENDYKYDSSVDSGQITINKALTINGNGYTIDGNKEVRIVYIDSDNVVLNNISFINGKSSYGGAIYSFGNMNIVNCSFVNVSAGYGGAIYSENSECVVSGCNFVTIYGPAILVVDFGNLTIVNCSFVDCVNNDQYIISTVRTTDLTIYDCSFVNCSSDNAIIYSNSDNFDVSRCTFVNASSYYGWHGGAIYSDSGNFNVSDSSFINITGDTGTINHANLVYNCSFVNVSAGYGGAIYSASSVVNCSFVNTHANYDGGAIYSVDSVVNCSFMGCSAGEYGGAIRSESDNLNVNGCSFVDCSAGKNGGAIYSKKSENVSIVNTLFVNNSPEDIYPSGLHTENVTFSSHINLKLNRTTIHVSEGILINITLDDGVTGDVFVSINDINETLTLTNSSVSLVKYNLSAGIYDVFVKYPGNNNFSASENSISFKVVEFTFKDLQELVDNLSDGEVLDLNQDYTYVSSRDSSYNYFYKRYLPTPVQIKKKITINGNGHIIDGDYDTRILDIYANAVLNNITFIKGTTDGMIRGVSYTYGGAIYSYGNITIINCNFNNNSFGFGAYSGKGAAIYSLGTINIINSNFTNNGVYNGWYFNYDGGAIYSMGNVNIVNSTFNSNYAVYSGAISGCGVNIVNSTFYDNHAGYAGAIYSYGNVNIVNSIFDYNTASYDYTGAHDFGGGAINCNGGLVICDENSIFTNNRVFDIYNFNIPNNLNINLNSTVIYENDSIEVNVFFTNEYIGIIEDITREITVSINGNEQKIPLVNGTATFILSDYAVGVYELNISYSPYKIIVYRYDDEGVRDYYYSYYAPYASSTNSTTFTVVDSSYLSFTDLQELIDNATKKAGNSLLGANNEIPTVDLNNNYIYGLNPNDKTIIIDESVIINGNGHSLLGNNMADMIIVNAENVVLNNLTFTNTTNCVINSSAKSTAVKSSLFKDNENYLIWFAGDDSLVDDSLFVDNDAKSGSLIYIAGNNAVISNSVFEDNEGQLLSASDDVKVILENNIGLYDNLTLIIDAPSSIDAGSVLYINLYLNYVLSGNVSVMVGVDEYVAKFAQGYANLSVMDLKSGNYDIVANFTNAFVSVTNSTHVGVNKKDSGFSCYDITVPEGTNATIEVYFNYNDYKDITGNITAILEGKNYSTIADGSSYYYEIILPALDIGNYMIPVVYSGDDKYRSANKTINVDVQAKRNSILDIFAASITEGDDAKINVILSDGASGNVTVNINGNNYSSTVYSEASIIIPGLDSGNYTANVYYSGDEWYNSANGSVVVNVIPKDVPKKNVTMEIHANPIRVFYSATIYVVLPEDAGGSVIFNFNGGNYSSDVIRGKASFTTRIYGAGNYTIPVVYSGDGLYNGANGSVVLNVIPYDAPYVDVSMNLSANPITEGETAIIDVILPSDADGSVYAYTDDISYYATLIDGNASISIPELAAGNYSISVYYYGHGIYSDTSGLVNLTVNPKSVTPKENLTLKASTTPISVGQVAIIVVEGFENATGNASARVGNGIYFAPIEDGVAVFRIQDLVENTTALISYSGDDKYNNASTSVDVVVYPAPVTPKENLTLVASTTPISVGQVAIIVVEGFENATGNASARVGNGVYFAAINGGSAIFRIQDLVANDTALISYSGDDKYNNASTTVDIVVYPAPKEDINASVSADPIAVGEDAVIKVSNLGNATGNVTATVGNDTYSAPIKDGETTITVPGLTENATVVVSYPGDDKYNNFTESIDIIVNPEPVTPKGNLTLVATTTPISVGQVAIVVVEGFENATGNASARVGNGIYFAAINGGSAVFRISDLIANDTALISYPGDDKYNNASTSVDIVVYPAPVTPKENLTLKASTTPITVGQVAIVVVEGFENATGNASARVGNGIYFASINGGIAVFRIQDLVANDTALISYLGDDKYNEASTSVDIIVNPVNTNITLSFAVNGNNVTLTADVSPSDLTGEVVFNVNGENYTAKIADSKATYVLANLEAGLYVANAIYAGNATHKSSQSNEVSFNISEDYVVITAPDVDKYYHGPERFAVTLTDSKGNPVTNASVSININGNDYTRVTDDKGVASMAINLNSGVYDVTTKYNASEVKSTVTIKATVSGENITKMFRNGTQYYATFYDTNGKTLANGTAVEFNINGVFYTRYTNEKGVARMNINLNPGEYIITAKNPNSTEMYTNIITVLPTIVENYDLTKYYKNASQYSLRLLDEKGNPVKAGVDVRLNINGVFYTRTSNADGYVKMNINLNPGEYIITAEYNGLMASNKIKVLSVIETENLNMKYQDGSYFNATILDGQGKPLANANVTFNINGVFYNKVTDENGVARLKINLMAGEYIITTTYNGLNAANKITISS